MFEKFLDLYRNSGGKIIGTDVHKDIERRLKSRNCKLVITNQRIKDKELICHLEEYAACYLLDKNFDYETQLNLMGLEISKYFNDGLKFFNAMAYSKNLILLDMIRKTNSVENKKLSEMLVKGNYGEMMLSYNELAAATISMFTSLYIYPFEELYMPTKEYSIDKKDLDFALLDTSFFQINTITINDNPLKEIRVDMIQWSKNLMLRT